MATTTDISDNLTRPDPTSEPEPGYAESAPLLGRNGDASQKEGRSIWYNLILGTAPLAQAGALLLTLHIWTTILLATPTPPALFTPHPLLNSAGLLVLTQSLLLLQPTHTPEQKRQGAILHGSLNAFAFLLFVGAFAIILANKFSHAGDHFASPHAVLGLVTYCLLGSQAAIGASMYWLPSLYGGEENAKSVWKYHRMSGYVVVLLALATVLAACWTDFNINVLDVKVWAVVVCGVLLVVGIGARIRLAKFGLSSAN